MALLYRGQPLKVEGADRVVNDPAYKFTSAHPNTDVMQHDPEVVGLHWTGGEGNRKRVFRTLEKKRLSVHFLVENDGTIVQMADLGLFTSHIGSYRDKPLSLNKRSFSIEVTCRGFARKEDLEGENLRERDELDWDVPRDVYPCEVDGRRVRAAAFGPAQRHSALWLTETLCRVFGIPRLMPMQKVKQVPAYLAKMGVKGVDNPPLDGMYVPLFDRDARHRGGRRSEFRGVLGHFHVHKTKYDPGTEFMCALWAEGFNPAGVKYPYVPNTEKLES